MGWEATLNRMIQNYQPQPYRPTASHGAPAFGGAPSYHPSPSLGHPVFGGSSRVGWNDLASGRLAKVAPPVGDANPFAPGTQQYGLDRFQVGFKTGGQWNAPQPPQPSTKGDFLGSALGSIGSIANPLNLGNFIPSFMEQVGKASHWVADQHVPVVSDAAGLSADVAHGFEGVLQNAAHVIAPAVDFVPEFLRGETLKQRAFMYRALAGGLGGQTANDAPLQQAGDLLSSPLSALGIVAQPFAPDLAHELKYGGPVRAILGRSTANYAMELQQWADVLHASTDPGSRATAQQHLDVLRATIDLPESVKRQIDGNPGASDQAVTQWLDKAPEGKAWSYNAGGSSLIQNAINPLTYYGIEGIVGSALGGLAAEGGSLASSESAVVRAVAAGVRTGGAAATRTGHFLTTATKVGLGLEALPLTAGAVARYQGNDAAIKWWDEYNQPGQFATDPNVQLLGSFAVNPFHVVPGTTKAIALVFKGGGRIILDAVTGDKFKRLFTQKDLIQTRLAQMYKLGSREEAAVKLAQHGWSESEQYTRVVDAAVQVQLSRLPEAERLALSAGDHPASVRDIVMRDYGNQVYDIIAKEPETLVAANMAHWNDRNATGPYNPDAALRMGTIYRQTSDLVQGLLDQTGTVLGRRHNLPPEAADAARTRFDAVTTPQGNVSMHDYQMIEAELPVLGDFAKGVIRGDAKFIPREAIDKVIADAQAAFEQRYRMNPVGETTGVTPALDPHSGTPQGDMADAMHTTTDTIAAIDKADVTDAAGVELARTFLAAKAPDVALRDKAFYGQLPPDEMYAAAAKVLDDTTRPWREQGQRVSSAGAAIGEMRAELARTWASQAGAERDAAIATIERDIARYERLVQDATDPATPFTAEVRLARRFGEEPAHVKAALTERARAIVGARDALTRLSDIATELDTMGATGRLFEKVEGDWMYSGGMPHLSTAFRARMAKGLANAGNKGAALSVYQMSDYDLWRLLLRDENAPIIREPLTAAQKAMVDQHPAMAAGADEHAATWGQGTQFGGGSAEGMGHMLAPDEAWSEAVVKLLDEKDSLLAPYGGSPARAEFVRRGKVPQSYLDAAVHESNNYGEWLKEQHDFEHFEHPRQQAKLGVAIDEALAHPSPEADGVVRDIVMGDQIMADSVREVLGQGVNDAIDTLGPAEHDSFMRFLRDQLIPADFVPPKEGLPDIRTAMDQALANHDPAAVERSVQDALDRNAAVKPVPGNPADIAPVYEAAVKDRRSLRYQHDFTTLGSDMAQAPDAAILAKLENRRGADVLSTILHGTTGRDPLTIEGVAVALKEIENGNAARFRGIGAGNLEEGRRVAVALLDDALKTRRAEVLSGTALGLPREPFYPEDQAALGETYADLITTLDPTNPLAGATYDLAVPPKEAILRKWSNDPGLAEEFMSKHFQPWEERLYAQHIRQAWSQVFGPRANRAVKLETRQRFIDRLSAQGISQPNARFIWDHLEQASHDSRVPVKIGPGKMVMGDFRKYATINNIPNGEINGLVWGVGGKQELGALQQIRDGARVVQDGRQVTLSMGPAEDAIASTLDFADAFRESSSFIRRSLKDSGGPLGEHLAHAYGQAVHNSGVTTFYYWFRFMLDPRYHAMNALEAQFLYLGKAGMKRGEFDQGILGMTSERLRNVSDQRDMFANGGYPFSRDRHGWAYRTFVKMQPEAIRNGLRRMQSESPEMIRAAYEEMFAKDPRILDEMTMLGEKFDPAKYMREVDAVHGKILRTATDGQTAEVVAAETRAAREANPEMAQLFDHLETVNNDLWKNVRETFYGNPDRSMAERVLNSYLLFWPLSYQIKSTKWWLHVLLDRAGGLPTNAGGAYLFNQLGETHQRLLATDPTYQDWFAKHKTLVRTAQMFFPVNFDGTGVTLNPLLRSVFIDSSHYDPLKMFDIGPIYTYHLLAGDEARSSSGGTYHRPGLVDELKPDVYPGIKDLPIIGEWLQPPKTATTKPPSP